jgi:hypothetical protein
MRTHGASRFACPRVPTPGTERARLTLPRPALMFRREIKLFHEVGCRKRT